MRNPFLFLLSVLLMLSACGEKNIVSQADVDEQIITEYLEKNQLEAESLPSGLYYIITAPGGEERPTVESTITVSYTGRFLNGSKFDESEFFPGKLSDMIQGWQQGIPLIGEGGRITLIVPSTLGYGGQTVGSIPPNSVLRFDVRLLYFSNP